MSPALTHLRAALDLVVGQEVVVELGAVEHAGEGFGRRGEGFRREAVVAGHGRRSRLGMLLAGAVDGRLFWEALVGQEVGLDRVLSGGELGCRVDVQSARCEATFDMFGKENRSGVGCTNPVLPSAAGFGSVAGGSEGVTCGTGSYFFSTGLGLSTDSDLYRKTVKHVSTLIKTTSVSRKSFPKCLFYRRHLKLCAACACG